MPRWAFACLALLFLFTQADAEQVGSKTLVRHHSVEPQEVVSGYWSLEPGWHTELEMGNNSVEMDLTIQPILGVYDGRQVRLPIVTVTPGEMKVVDLRQAIQTAAPELLNSSDAYGSVIFRYEAAAKSNLYASTMVYRDGLPIAFHFAAMAPKFAPKRALQHGIWWLPTPSTSGYLLLTNLSDAPTLAHVSIDTADKVRHQTAISLAPRQTRRESIREIVTKAGWSEGTHGGITVSVQQDDGAVLVSEILFDETTGFNAVMRFSPPGMIDKRAEQRLLAPMVALGDPDPALTLPSGTHLRPLLFLRNVTTLAIPVTLEVSWTAGQQTATNEFSLDDIAPGETRLVDLAKLGNGSLVAANANWAAVSVRYTGTPSDIVAVSASYDESGRYGVQSPFSPFRASHWKGGRWRVDSSHNTLLATGNAGVTPTTALVTLYYSGGKRKYELPPRKLRPGEQYLINIEDLIRSQVPDRSGQVIPLTETSGMFEFAEMELSRENHLYEGRLMIDKTYGHATYGCACCCGFQPPYLYPDLYRLSPGLSQTGQVSVRDGCSGWEENVTDWSWNWTVFDISIARVLAPAALEGVDVGFTGAYAYVDLPRVEGYDCLLCPSNTERVDADVISEPTVSFNSGDLTVLIGGDPTVIDKNLQSAQGIPTGGTYSWSSSDPNISFDNPSASRVKIEAHGFPGSADIQVGYTYMGHNATPASRAITKRIFVGLQQSGAVQLIQLGPPLNNSYRGYTASVLYNVLTDPNKQVLQPGYGGIAVSENVEDLGATVNGIPVDIPTQNFFGDGALDENSRVSDNLSMKCVPATSYCLPPGYQSRIRQEVTVGNIFVRRNLITRTPTNVGIAKEAPLP